MVRKSARKWNPSLHPRDARGRFTRSSTRVMKSADTKRARSATTGFSPAKIGGEGDARGWLDRNTSGSTPPPADSALGQYLAGGWRETNPAIRANKTPPPGVEEIDAEFGELPEDVVLRRQVPLAMFAHIPVEDLVGMKVRDAAYASTSLDRPDAGESAADAVTMHIAAAAGTPAYINAPDGEILLARDTEIAVTRAEPNGRGGWDLYGVVIPKTAVKRDRAAAPDQGGQQDPAAPADSSRKPAADTADGSPDADGGEEGGRGRADRTPRTAAAPDDADEGAPATIDGFEVPDNDDDVRGWYTDAADQAAMYADDDTSRPARAARRELAAARQAMQQRGLNTRRQPARRFGRKGRPADQQPTGDATPAADAPTPEAPAAGDSVSPADLVAARETLTASVMSGVAQRRMLDGGSIADVELVTFNDGSRAVFKRTASGAARDAGTQQDAEELGALTLTAFGVRAAAIDRAGTRDIYAQYIDGRSGMEAWAISPAAGAAQSAQVAASDAGRLMGLADLVMGNIDRNSGNWMIDQEGRLVGIDHGHGFMYREDPLEVGRFEVGEFGVPYVARDEDMNPTGWADHDISPADIATARARLVALRPDYVRLGHTDWHDTALARLDAIGAHATGTRDRITRTDRDRELLNATPPTGDETPAAGTGAPDGPPAPDGVPQDRVDAYERGWAAAQSGVAGELDAADERGESDDFYQGYDDQESGRAKWASLRPARPAAPTLTPAERTAMANRQWTTRQLGTVGADSLRQYQAAAERDGDTEGTRLIAAEIERRAAIPVAPLGVDLTGGRDLFAGRSDASLRAEMSRLRGNRDRTDAIRAELDRRAAAPAAGTSAPETPDTPVARADALSSQAAQRMNDGDYRGALDLIDQAEQAAPNHRPGKPGRTRSWDDLRAIVRRRRDEAARANTPEPTADNYGERRDRLAAGVASGIASREPLGGGLVADGVDLVTFNSGDRAVYKRTAKTSVRSGRPFGNGHSGYNEVTAAQQQDAEELGAAVAAAMGASAPAVLRASDTEIYVEHIDGQTGLEVPSYDLGAYVDSDSGRRLGLADVIMGNSDRSMRNWLVDGDGNVQGIDHGLAFGLFDDPGTAPMRKPDPFASHFVKIADPGRPNEWADHDFTPADMAEARRRLVGLRPEFERLGHADWHDAALARLDALTPHATGTRNRVADGDDPGTPTAAAPDAPEAPETPSTGEQTPAAGTRTPDAPETPAAPAPRAPFAERQTRLAEAVAAGVTNREDVTGDGGFLSDVSVVTFGNGDRAIHKTIPAEGGVGRPAEEMQDAEELAVVLAAAVGAPVPAVHRAGPGEVYVEFVDGRTALDLVVAADGNRSAVAPYVLTDDSWLLGLADLLMGNTDRHEGNWMIDRDGRLVGIDHGLAFWNAANGPRRPSANESSPFTDRFMKSNALGFPSEWTDHDFTPADLAEVRRRLYGIRPQFDDKYRSDWINFALIRLDALTPYAKGTRNRIAAGDDTSAPEPPAAASIRVGDMVEHEGEWVPVLSKTTLQVDDPEVQIRKDGADLWVPVTELTGRRDGDNTGAPAPAAGTDAPSAPAPAPAAPPAPTTPPAPTGPAQQADMFGGVTDFVPAPRAAIGLADRPNIGRERAIAAVQQLGMFDVSDQQQMDGQMALLDALLDVPAPTTPPPPAPEPETPAAPEAPEVPASIVPDDLSGWTDEDLAETFRTVTGVHDLAQVDEDGAARIMAEWERREAAMAELVSSVPDDLTPVPDGDLEGLYARITGEHGSLDHPTADRLLAELERRAEADRQAAENAPKRALLDRPVADLDDDEVDLAAEYAADLDDPDALARVVAEMERRDAEREAAAERERIEREAREAVEREAALEAARVAEREAAAAHAAAQRDRLVDAMAAAQDAAIVPAYDNSAIGAAHTALGEDGIRALYGDATVDQWVADVPGGTGNDQGRWTAIQRRLIEMPSSERVRLVSAAAEQAAAEEFADYDDRELHAAVSQGMFSAEPPNGPAPARERGRRAAREKNRRKIQELRADNAREFRQYQIRAMAADPATLTDAELEVAPALVTATGADDYDLPGRLAALRAEAQRRELAAISAAEAKAAGPAGPARYRSPVEEYGYLRQMVQGRNARDIEAQDRLRRAQAVVFGLPEDADAKAVKAAERKDPRPVADQAALVMAWFRHLGRYEGVDQNGPDYYRGKPDEDVPDTPAPEPPANVSKPDEVWKQIHTNALQEINTGRFDTASRMMRAIARAYRVPMGEIEQNRPGIVQAQESILPAMRHDQRTEKQRAADFIAQFRRLADEDGVDPTDTLRAGPPDKATRRASSRPVRESTPEQEARIDALVARGWDWLDAYAEVHGVDRASLERSAGGRSGLTEKQLKEAYAEYVERQYRDAEAATSGYLLKRGSEGKMDARRLFSGSWSVAKAHASEELMRWWGEHPRLTYAAFKAQYVGGDSFRSSRERLAAAGKGNEFA
ncbi:hypothetical protein ACIBTV_27840 [Micromonospora sp. NPDC049366]|uniref:hypothetical protein n=1 Tax=Micromonospora sp. NPDC049366 TaxID=3364271 RepID=UPI00379367D4